MTASSSEGLTLGKIVQSIFVNLLIVLALMLLGVPIFAELLGTGFGTEFRNVVLTALGHPHPWAKVFWFTFYLWLIAKDVGVWAWCLKHLPKKSAHGPTPEPIS